MNPNEIMLGAIEPSNGAHIFSKNFVLPTSIKNSYKIIPTATTLYFIQWRLLDTSIIAIDPVSFEVLNIGTIQLA